VPEPKEGEFQIKIVAASLCHSDLMTNLIPKDSCFTIGHEAAGIISKIHPSAEGNGFKVGDKVGFMGNADNCFECDGCRLHASYCTNPKNGRSKINGLECDGFFAEYAVIDWRNAIRVPDILPIERASPLFCAGITGKLLPSLRILRLVATETEQTFHLLIFP
jgi:D-arabinose 1-dehydrogenase-like Zn-dependent alcohol dehydrogenase